jgi:hypothetical protein
MGHIRSQEIVDSALLLSDIGLIDADNALVHGVAVQTIRRRRREYQRQGRPRGQAHTSVLCPRCDGADLDEAVRPTCSGGTSGTDTSHWAGEVSSPCTSSTTVATPA